MNKQKNIDDFKAVMAGYIQKKMQASLFLLLNVLKDLDNEEFMPEILSSNKEIFEIKEFIRKTSLNLEDILDGDSKEIEKAMEDLFETKNELKSFGNSVFGYNYAKNLSIRVLSYFDRLHGVEQMTMDENLNIDTTVLIEDCMDYIESEAIESYESEKKSDIISCFPLRMTRQKYNDYIKRSLMKISHGFSEQNIKDFIKTLELRFLPFESEIYGKYFDIYKEQLASIFDSEFEMYNEKNFDDAWDKLEEIDKELEELLYYMDMILEASTYLTLVLSFSSGFEFIFEENLLYKDIYFAFKENYATENFEVIVDSFTQNLDNALENILDECLVQEKIIDKIVEKSEHLREDEISNNYLQIYKIVNSVYSESLVSLCFPLSVGMKEEDTPAEDSYIEEIVDEFIGYINDSLVGLKNNRQKLVKQFFLEVVPCFMEDKELKEYLQYTFGEVKTTSERMLVVDNVGKIFEQKGFKESSLQDEHEGHHLDHQHNHTHEHDCGCGHDHHHDHEHNHKLN